MDLQLIAAIAIAVIVVLLVVGGIAGVITNAVNRGLQRRREEQECPGAPHTSSV